MDNIESGFVAADELTHILIWATAGADARMGGSDYPAMVSTASGNQGAMVVSWAPGHVGVPQVLRRRTVTAR